MFGVSLPELLVIFAVVLIVFGPERLPEIARTIGKLAGDLRRTSDQVRREFYNSVYKPADEVSKRINQEVRSLTSIPSEPSTPKTGEADATPKPPTEPKHDQ